MTRHLHLLSALALGACTASPISSAPTTGTPTAAFNQVAKVGQIRVRPTKLIEDSRCPALVRCVWAGRLIVRVEIEGGAGADFADLTLGEPLQVGGLLTLVAAEPQKATPGEIDPRAYRFTFDFQGGL